MDTVEIQPQDQKFFVNDRNFNPGRNKAIIAETIRETEKFFNDIGQLADKEQENRIDILTSYGVYRFNKGTKNVKSYLGRELYNKVIGEKILSKVKVMDSINRLNGNTKFRKSILL